MRAAHGNRIADGCSPPVSRAIDKPPLLIVWDAGMPLLLRLLRPSVIHFDPAWKPTFNTLVAVTCFSNSGRFMKKVGVALLLLKSFSA